MKTCLLLVRIKKSNDFKYFLIDSIVVIQIKGD